MIFRRSLIKATVSTGTIGVAGCVDEVGIATTPTPIVNQEFSEPHEERVDVSSGETLRVEVTPRNPKYQLVMMVVKEENLNEEEGLSAITEITEIDTTTAKEVTAESDTTFIIGVGWFNEEKDLETSQYHLLIRVLDS